MKKVLTAFIEQVIQFDCRTEFEAYKLGLKNGKFKFCIKDVKSDADGKVYATVRKQYNNNVFPDAE